MEYGVIFATEATHYLGDGTGQATNELRMASWFAFNIGADFNIIN